MWLCAPRVGIVLQPTVNVRISTSSCSNNLGNSRRAPTYFSSSSSVRFVMFCLSECGASVLCTYASGNCGTRKDCRGLERATSESTVGEIIPRLQWDLRSPWTVLQWEKLMLSEVVMRIAEGSHSLTSLRVPARRHTFLRRSTFARRSTLEISLCSVSSQTFFECAKEALNIFRLRCVRELSKGSK
jgi:hypothetical protein